jgi:proline dehydrogenase
MHPINHLMISMIRLLPKAFVKPVAMRYIAGERLDDAIRVLGDLNSKKMMATVDVLGENVSTKEESLQATKACQDVLEAIEKKQLDSSLSIKLTQLGLKLDQALCYENVKSLLTVARSHGTFVRIDMEDSSTTTPTLQWYEKLRSDGFENVGVVIQSYLRRSEEDIKGLIRRRANVRLVKGIYVEPEAIAFKDKEEIHRNYLKLLRMLLEARCYAGIATHDDFLIRNAYQYIREMKLQRSDYEFQMLYGVRVKLRDQIVADGHRMRIYVPFGMQWYSYSMRRFQENPQIARYVLQAILSRNS